MREQGADLLGMYNNSRRNYLIERQEALRDTLEIAEGMIKRQPIDTDIPRLDVD